MGGGGEAVWIDADAVRSRAGALGDLGGGLSRDAGGADRSVPAAPDDPGDLAQALIAFDEAREAFEQNLGRSVSGLADEVNGVADDAEAADVGPLSLDPVNLGGIAGALAERRAGR